MKKALIITPIVVLALIFGFYTFENSNVEQDTKTTENSSTEQLLSAETLSEDTSANKEEKYDVPPLELPEEYTNSTSSEPYQEPPTITVDGDIVTVVPNWEKPTYTEEELTNPDKAPNEQALEAEEPVEQEIVPEVSTTTTQNNQTSSEEIADGTINEAGTHTWIGGFGWVEGTGSGSTVEIVGSDGDYNKIVGSMG